MNPKLRRPLIVIGLITIAVIAIFVIPRGLSLYYQIRGGQRIEYILRFEEGLKELVCEPLSPANEDARIEVEYGRADLNRAIKLNNNNAQAYYYLGKAHCLLGNPDNAVEDYSTYTEIRPDNPLGYIGLGFAYEKLENPTLTISSWESARISPDHFNSIGDEEYISGRYEIAIQWYERALLLDPTNIESIYGIGITREAQNQWEDAIDNYKTIIGINPSHTDSYYKIGEILFNKLNRFEESLEYFEIASKIDSVPVRAYVGIGDAENRLGNEVQALIAYQHAVDLSQEVEDNSVEGQWERVWPYYALGSIQLNLGQYEEARKAFLKGIERDNDNRWSGWLLWGLGRISLMTGDYEQSQAYFERVLDVSENIFLRSQSYFGLGQVNIQMGKIDEGLRLIRLAKIEHPENRDLHFHYVKSLFEYGYVDEGTKELANLLERWPDDNEANRLLEEMGN